MGERMRGLVTPPPVQGRGRRRVLPWPLSVLSDTLHSASALSVTDHPQCAAWGCLNELEQVLLQEPRCSGGGMLLPSA